MDTFGVGLSSRGKYDNKMNHEETISYYIDSIEQWREKVGIDEFILVGHSFGGYIATLYCEKYQKRVNRLVLLSPAGASEKTE